MLCLIIMAKQVVKCPFLFVFLIHLCVQIAEVEGSLKPGDMLNTSTTVFSPNGMSRLQFLDYGGSPSPTYYLVIITNNAYSWFANRDEPIYNDSVSLTLDHSGVLKIIHQGGKPIIIYNSSSSAQSTPINTNTLTARLLDSGNFVLLDESTKRKLWQSFDYPFNKLISGMKLGVNHRSGRNWSVISTLTNEIPSSGAFTLEWEPKRLELMIRRQGQVCWTSGTLGENNKFEYIPEQVQSMFKYTVVDNKDEGSFSFATAGQAYVNYTHWKLLDTGRLFAMAYQSEDIDIARADLCDGYNTDGGCQAWILHQNLPTCRHHSQTLELMYGSFKFNNSNNVYPRNATEYDCNASISTIDCWNKCWSDCDCVGFTDCDSSAMTGCLYYYGSLWQVIASDANGDRIYHLKMRSDHKGTKKWILISTVTASVLLIFFLFTLCLVLKIRKTVHKERKRKRMETQMIESDESSSVNSLPDNINKEHDLKVFSYASVMAATNGFSSDNKLGEGGFGPVYKGKLPTGEDVAVKRLSKTSGQGVVEFKNELTLICELQHRNLVQLLGCCIHGKERILIYEYMPNKSLDFFLFDSTQSKLLNWRKRFKIIEGIAQGLLYLHKYSRLRVIHRDLKASNILLDANMSPKIADFGMAKMFTEQESEANTNRIVGTYGYMSPEYAMEGLFSTKSDVYSFGVLLLEIVSGRRNNNFYNADRAINLVGHTWELWTEGVGQQLMDPAINDSFVEDEVLRCIQIGLLCVEEKAEDRPTMSDIISMLTNNSAAISLPKRPAFYTGKRIFEATTSSKESDIDSIYQISLSHSQMNPR